MATSTNIVDEAFLARLEAYGHCDVLIDRFAGFPLRDDLAGRILAQEPLADPLLASMPDERPLLVRIAESEQSLIEAYLAYAGDEACQPGTQSRAVCAFLFTPLPLASLARRLARHLDLRIQTGQRLFFRYFDPRVFHHLPRLLRPTQMAQLLHGIDHWSYLHWRGGLANLPVTDFGPRPDAPAYVRLSVDSAQWAALQGIETYNLALRALRQGGAPLDDDLEPRLLTAVATAHAQRLPTADDHATLAAHLVCNGEGILRLSLWQEALQLARHDAIPLKDILEDRLAS